MKTYIKNIVLTSLISPLFFSCSSYDEPEILDNGKKLMTFDCVIGDTRATDTAFESGDKIGVFVVKAGELIQPTGNEVNNESFTFNGSAWSSSKKVYWNDGTFDVYAYYPYTGTIADTEEMLFSVGEDQSTHAGYTASDFVWASRKGVTGSSSPVSLSFTHSLSKAVVVLEKGEGFTGNIPSDCEVYLHSTALEAAIDLESGNAEASAYSPTGTIKAYKKNATTFEAIVVPQNITSRRPLVEVVTEGVSYLMEGKISFRPGYSHNIIITLTKNPEETKIEIGGSIGGWN